MPVIGILGGGQLGRMTALAAANLGISCHIFTPERDSPAAQVSAGTFVADYSDEAALTAFAASVDVITLEFENIPPATIWFLKRFKPVYPDDGVLEITQDRVAEKSFVNHLDFKTAPWVAINNSDELKRAVLKLGAPAILKTTRFGYDGKGQTKILSPDDCDAVWRELVPAASKQNDFAPAILEGFVDFEKEVSVLVARNQQGQIATYPVAENIHCNHILAKTHIPARITPAVEAEARAIAMRIAEKINLVGLLCIELFVCRDGSLLVNEMAPRPHNSGHWTMDACMTSQFEQLVRIVAGFSLGSTDILFPCVMENLIGDDVLKASELLQVPHNRVHLYGKTEARAGRKMGHVTRLMR